MRRLLRRVVSYALFALGWPALLLHPKLREGISVRLGWVPARPLPPGGPTVWLHGASAGDILALKPLALRLKHHQPQMRIVASTITNSGRAMAERHSAAFDAVTYLPYDLPGAVARTLRRLQPDALVLEYTELWPELIDATKRRGVRLVLNNGRIAAANVRSYRWLFRLTGNVLEAFDAMLMRSNAEAERARLLGAPAARVHVTGNTKFDNLLAEAQPELTMTLRAAAGLQRDAAEAVWVAGSTHEGEEEHVLQAFDRLRADAPHLRLIIAPRYIERSERLLNLAQRLGWSTRRRSQPGEAVDVLILDTIGELVSCYNLATVVFVGGSLVPRGGQNILEAAACGKPVVFGPHMQNFTDSVQLLLGRGGLQVASSEQLARVVGDLLANPQQRAELGTLARAQTTSVRGAAERNARAILGLVNGDGAA